jgi:hypothetical protein
MKRFATSGGSLSLSVSLMVGCENETTIANETASYVQELRFAAPILIAGIMESLFTYQGKGLADFVSSGHGLFNWDDARVLVNPGEAYTNPDGSPKGRTHIRELAPLYYERISSASKNR